MDSREQPTGTAFRGPGRRVARAPGPGRVRTGLAATVAGAMALLVAIGGARAAPAGFSFEPPLAVPVTFNEYPQDVALGDLNGDGRLDIVVAVLPQDPTASRLEVLLNRGKRSFDPVVIYPALGWIEDTAMGDVDGDGNLDVVAAYGWYGPNQISILPGAGDGTLATRLDVLTGGKTVRPAIRDLDGDGHADITLATPQANGVTVLRGNGDGSFAPPVLQSAGPNPWDVTIAHIDGDSIPDLAVPCEYLNGVAILLGTGGGSFAPPVPYYTSRYAFRMAAGDVNGDGHTDLAVTSFDYHTVSVLRNRGDGTFGAKRDYTSVAPTSNGDPHDVALGDLNGDGWPDLVAANRLANTVAVNLNRGDGTFASKQTFPCGNGPDTVRLGDMDDDGVLDAVVPNDLGRISILFGVRMASPAGR